MSKRFVWILFLVTPLAIIALIIALTVLYQFTHPFNFEAAFPPVDRNQVNLILLERVGVLRDITTQEVEEATNMLVQERRMWSQFNGMSGDIDVEFDGSDGKHLSLEGNVSLHRLDLSPLDKRMRFIAKYEMTISDKRGGWTVKTDGTSKNTVITCQDPQLSEAIKTIDPTSILHMLTFPQYYLAAIYRDELYPQAIRDIPKRDQMLKILLPWRMTNAVPHSYTFWDSYPAGFPVSSFMNGHFYQFRRMEGRTGRPWKENIAHVKEKVGIYFENSVESNGFWYPTVFRITPAPTPWPYPLMSLGIFVPQVPLAHAGQLRITLSNVSLSVK